ncbi:hypothetical protein QBC38DRAFT_484076 [Podospora fimiseda]|uniref:Uncharacterized protein n=1 Tax=Podospora fimiseda TaxID=252190 RepID=A0AAN7BKN1_9PEZI|nr:hypothetical protein QBC38DRAFT_484076 [Podospora fimiseda]
MSFGRPHAQPAGTMMESQYARRPAPPIDPGISASYSHSRTRTTSSNIFPVQYPSPAPPNNNYYSQTHLVQPQSNHQRRSPSVNTFSSISSGGMGPQGPYRNSPPLDVRRSTSSRSGGTPGSPQAGGYVALLRKQKATVWCDRAQQEDPGMLARQRAAKMRANAEVIGANNVATYVSTARTSTGLSSTGGKVAAKIRHHGKPTVVDYSPGNNHIGVGGVPLRLSATEVEGGESDEEENVIQRMNHRRTTSSSRSSTASGRKAGYRSSGGLGTMTSTQKQSPTGTPERTGSLVDGEAGIARGNSTGGKARSFGGESGSSGERLDVVADLAANPALAGNSLKNAAAVTREKSLRTPDELKRRGSVDERTMTLTAGRLYIANPD